MHVNCVISEKLLLPIVDGNRSFYFTGTARCGTVVPLSCIPSFSQILQTNLRITLDGTSIYGTVSDTARHCPTLYGDIFSYYLGCCTPPLGFTTYTSNFQEQQKSFILLTGIHRNKHFADRAIIRESKKLP